MAPEMLDFKLGVWQHQPMKIVDIYEAKAQLCQLIEEALAGEACVIAEAGRPLVKVTSLEPAQPPQRLDFMAGEIAVAEDFDTMGAAEIDQLFGARA